MIFKIHSHERNILQTISETAGTLGFPVYVVGGYVRDRLLSRPSKDMDIVCVGSGIRLAQEVAARLRPMPRIAVFQRFGTAMIKHGDMEIEFVGARKESYRPDSRKPSVEEGTLEDDQHRRDFTINALAVSLNTHDYGHILDPFNGLKHLEERLIKTPLEPGKTFSDDPLRMMRAIRFSSQLDFDIEPATFDAIRVYRDRISIVSMERVSIELNKIIAAKVPSKGLNMLFDTGLLKLIFPELAHMYGIERKQGRAHKDNFYHTLEVLDNLARQTDNLWLRWAAVLHDIAKPNTKRFEPEHGWTFHGHEVVGAAMVPRIFQRLKLPLDHKMKYVQKMVQLHMRPISLTKENITDAAIRRLLVDANEDLEDLMMLCRADITSKNPSKVQRYLENYEMVQERLADVESKDHLRNWQPPITGEIIMETFGLKPSREVGLIKTAVREAILDGDIPNDYEAAFQRMLSVSASLGIYPVS
jgi:poly(A) polymerase